MVAEKRRVIKQGNNTLTVTLPKDWTSQFNIQAGDELTVLQRDRSLVLDSEKLETDSKVEIDVSNLSLPLILRYIVSAYRSGYDEIRVIYGKENVKKTQRWSYTSNYNYMFGERTELDRLDAVQIIVNGLIGVAIIDQKESYCVIKELSKTSYKEFDAAIRRMFLLLLSMAEECNTAIKSKDYESLHKLNNIDYNINNFNNFALRVLNKKGYEKFGKTSTMYSLLFLLEMVGDEYKKLGSHLKEFKKIGKEIRENFDLQYNQLRRVYEMFYGFSKEKCEEIFKEDLAGDTINKGFYLQLSSTDQEILHHLKKIGIYVLSLVELAIDLHM